MLTWIIFYYLLLFENFYRPLNPCRAEWFYSIFYSFNPHSAGIDLTDVRF